MKHKLKFSDIGRSTYFHHQNGVVFFRKRSRISALYAGSMLAVAGGFFVISQLAIPAINKQLRSFQNQKPVAAPSLSLAEPKSNETNLPEIKRDNEALTALIKDKIATFSNSSNWAVFVYDLEEDRTVNINSDKVFESASLYKLFLIEALENKLPFDKWQKTKLPDKTTVKDCVQAMLQSSDSACGEEIGKFIGWDAVYELIKEWFSATKIIQRTYTTPPNTGEL